MFRLNVSWVGKSETSIWKGWVSVIEVGLHSIISAISEYQHQEPIASSPATQKVVKKRERP